MKQGEKIVLIVIVLAVAGTAAFKLLTRDTGPDKGIPFHTTASAELAQAATEIYKRNSCKDCHSLWTERDMLQSVPAPALDGIGSLHDEEWFYKYFSAPNPQENHTLAAEKAVPHAVICRSA